eukprot:Rhum_TRINITY_DN6592_c0_g1::Rhum_TRINITY_DN6592_c0_g1_i1::g.20506::m.20506
MRDRDDAIIRRSNAVTASDGQPSFSRYEYYDTTLLLCRSSRSWRGLQAVESRVIETLLRGIGTESGCDAWYTTIGKPERYYIHLCVAQLLYSFVTVAQSLARMESLSDFALFDIYYTRFLAKDGFDACLGTGEVGMIVNAYSRVASRERLGVILDMSWEFIMRKQVWAPLLLEPCSYLEACFHPSSARVDVVADLLQLMASPQLNQLSLSGRPRCAYASQRERVTPPLLSDAYWNKSCQIPRTRAFARAPEMFAYAFAAALLHEAKRTATKVALVVSAVVRALLVARDGTVQQLPFDFVRELRAAGTERLSVLVDPSLLLGFPGVRGMETGDAASLTVLKALCAAVYRESSTVSLPEYKAVTLLAVARKVREPTYRGPCFLPVLDHLTDAFLQCLKEKCSTSDYGVCLTLLSSLHTFRAGSRPPDVTLRFLKELNSMAESLVHVQSVDLAVLALVAKAAYPYSSDALLAKRYRQEVRYLSDGSAFWRLVSQTLAREGLGGASARALLDLSFCGAHLAGGEERLRRMLHEEVNRRFRTTQCVLRQLPPAHLVDFGKRVWVDVTPEITRRVAVKRAPTLKTLITFAASPQVAASPELTSRLFTLISTHHSRLCTLPTSRMVRLLSVSVRLRWESPRFLSSLRHMLSTRRLGLAEHATVLSGFGSLSVTLPNTGS